MVQGDGLQIRYSSVQIRPSPPGLTADFDGLSCHFGISGFCLVPSIVPFSCHFLLDRFHDKLPENPGEYLCGIECDGEAYHTNPISRERDRLREEILNARGWQLHRIWGMEWLRNRDYENTKNA